MFRREGDERYCKKMSSYLKYKRRNSKDICTEMAQSRRAGFFPLCVK